MIDRNLGKIVRLLRLELRLLPPEGNVMSTSLQAQKTDSIDGFF